MSKKLAQWLTIYGADALNFECEAEDIAHAIEQTENAYPGEQVRLAQLGLDTPCSLPVASKATKARLFKKELMDSVETLTGIVEQYNVATLIDLMYLQQAILEGGFIDHYPTESDSQLLDVVLQLPSADLWVTYIQCLEQDIFAVMVKMTDGSEVQWKGLADDQIQAEMHAIQHAKRVAGSNNTVAGITKVAMIGVGQSESNQNHTVARALANQIQSDIALLRRITDDPLSIKYGNNVDFEIRHIADDDRMLVGRDGWGFTTVNYTSEGVIVDVIPESCIDSVTTWTVYKEDLEDPCADRVKE